MVGAAILLLFSSSVSSCDCSFSVSAVSLKLLVKRQFKFHLGYENTQCVRIYIISVYPTIAYLGKITFNSFFFLQTPDVIFVKRCFSPLKRNIPAAAVSHLAESPEGERHESKWC